MDGEMLLSAEDRVAYWGYMHENISCRDINDDEGVDLVGLERILYGVGFLAVAEMRGIIAFDDEISDKEAEEESEEPFFGDYEEMDSSLNPFEYEALDEDDFIQPSYPSMDDWFSIFEDYDSGSRADPGDFEDFPELEEDGLDDEAGDDEELEEEVLRPAA